MWAALVNHLWQSTVFVGVVALAVLAVRNDGAHIRYWLWWAASVKFLVPFSWLAALGRNLVPGDVMLYVPDTWSAAAERVAQPVAGAGPPAWLSFVLLSIWGAGGLAVLAYWIVRARRVQGMLRRAEPAPTPLFDGSRRIDVYYSPELVEPSLAGVFSSALLLPQGIGAHLTAAQLDAVIAHEICHVRRRDNQTAAAHMLVEALFWFHPIVWWIGGRLVDERERACDEAVIRSGRDRKAYAEGMLNVCELYVTSPLACAAGIGGADLNRRVTRIMRGEVMSKLRLTKKVFLTVAAAGALGVPVLAGMLSHGVALAQEDEAWLPVVKVAPVYPEAARESGLEGSVVLEYTVNERGVPEDVTVVEATSEVFEGSAVDAVKKFRYEPRTRNGEPVAVPGVRSKIAYAMEAQEQDD